MDIMVQKQSFQSMVKHVEVKLHQQQRFNNYKRRNV